MVMRSLLFLLVFIASTCLPPDLAAEDIRLDFSASRIDAIDAAVRQQMEEQDLAGVAIGWLSDGKLVLTRGYGLADRTENTPVTSETVFNWASNSKPLAAVLAMQLAEAGRLDLDVDIRNYVPQFPKKEYVITTRHLLSHQSGIPHYRNGEIRRATTYVASERDLDPLVAIGSFSESALIFEPG